LSSTIGGMSVLFLFGWSTHDANLWICSLHGNRNFADVIELRLLRWEGYPRFSGWVWFYCKKEQWRRTYLKTTTLWLCRWRKGSSTKECESLRNLKRQGNSSSFEACRENAAWWHIHLAQRDFWPTELQGNTFALFQASMLVVICYRSNRKLIEINNSIDASN
jgi:hypothetical protein